MHRPSLRTGIVAALLGILTVPALAAAQTPTPSIGVRQTEHHIFVDPDRLEWTAGPASLPAGAQMAVIEGDPSSSGLFTMRLRLPDGYRIAPHFHGADEHVTVLSGTFVMGLGDTWNADGGMALAPGGFAVMPAGTRHFAWSQGETILQIHAAGPWTLTYVDAADDPRTPPPGR